MWSNHFYRIFVNFFRRLFKMEKNNVNANLKYILWIIMKNMLLTYCLLGFWRRIPILNCYRSYDILDFFLKRKEFFHFFFFWFLWICWGDFKLFLDSYWEFLVNLKQNARSTEFVNKVYDKIHWRDGCRAKCCKNTLFSVFRPWV